MPPLSSSGVSPDLWTAWELTRRIAVRLYVQKARVDADGRVHAGSANNYPDRHALSPICPETPWYIHLADDRGLFRILCFDFDGKDKGGHSSPELVEAAADQTEELCGVLTQLGIPHVLCESSSSGGRHVWVALAEHAPVEVTRVLAEAAGANYPQLDHGMLSNRVTGGARPPLSPHRNGSYSRVLAGDVAVLTDPTTTLEQLRALTEQLQQLAPPARAELSIANGPAVASHRPHRELPEWGARHMATAGGGSNPSRTAYNALIAAASAGWTYADVVRAAETAPGLEHFRSRNNGHGKRTKRSRAQMHDRLEKQWAKAQVKAAAHVPLPAPREPKSLGALPELVEAARAILAAFDADPKRWGSTLGRVRERSTIASLAYLTLMTGKRDVAAAVRDLGPIGGGSKSATGEALDRLAKAGLIAQTRATSGPNASEWRLTPHYDGTSDTTRTHPKNQNTRPPAEILMEQRVLLNRFEELLTDQRHDIFSYEGLGHFAGIVYAFLQENTGYTVSQLVLKLGMRHRHVVASLSRLRKHRLVVHAGAGWARSRRDARAQIARRLGVRGILSARAQTYQVDREVWEWWQAEYATMTSAPRYRPPRRHVTSRPLYDAQNGAEMVWPRYPRDRDGLGDHVRAREHVRAGHLSPTSRIQLAA